MLDNLESSVPKPWKPHTNMEMLNLVRAYSIYKCDLQLNVEGGYFKNIYGRPKFDFSRERYRVHPDFKYLLPKKEGELEARSIPEEAKLLSKSMKIVLGTAFGQKNSEAIIEITDLIRKKFDKITLRELTSIKTEEVPF